MMHMLWFSVCCALLIIVICEATRICTSEFSFTLTCGSTDGNTSFFTDPSPSRVSCSSQCAANERCFFFTYEANICRTYSEHYTISSNVNNSCFVTASLLKSSCPKRMGIGEFCMKSPDCNVENSFCWEYTCRCRPGYYYSHSDDSCVASKYDSTFTHFMKLRLVGCCEDSVLTPDSETCKKVCEGIRNPICVSFMYTASFKKCKLVTTVDGASHYSVMYDERYLYMQRDCALLN